MKIQQEKDMINIQKKINIFPFFPFFKCYNCIVKKYKLKTPKQKAQAEMANPECNDNYPLEFTLLLALLLMLLTDTR